MADVVNRGTFPDDPGADTLYDSFGNVNTKFDAVDGNLPTADEKAALAGTGTPSAVNKYVTEDTVPTGAAAKALKYHLI